VLTLGRGARARLGRGQVCEQRVRAQPGEHQAHEAAPAPQLHHPLALPPRANLVPCTHATMTLILHARRTATRCALHRRSRRARSLARQWRAGGEQGGGGARTAQQPGCSSARCSA